MNKIFVKRLKELLNRTSNALFSSGTGSSVELRPVISDDDLLELERFFSLDSYSFFDGLEWLKERGYVTRVNGLIRRTKKGELLLMKLEAIKEKELG